MRIREKSQSRVDKKSVSEIASASWKKFVTEIARSRTRKIARKKSREENREGKKAKLENIREGNSQVEKEIWGRTGVNLETILKELDIKSQRLIVKTRRKKSGVEHLSWA
ncbi:50S ribosomal protein L28 [Striga asiatica]|uniref:50S ribosomal protein L28 n=1 Tax=Striga asiatica TaxID=4170 RepID=A0A5A7QP15_STRAF|nr:50S ribosomal protein L28 [Striga asiatica]